MFADLIIKNSKTVTAETSIEHGSITKGIYSPGSKVICEVNLAIFPMSGKELIKYEAGTYTAQDITIFIPNEATGKRLDTNKEVIINLKDGDRVITEKGAFVVKSDIDFTDLADFKKYVGKKEVVKK